MVKIIHASLNRNQNLIQTINKKIADGIDLLYSDNYSLEDVISIRQDMFDAGYAIWYDYHFAEYCGPVVIIIWKPLTKMYFPSLYKWWYELR